MIPELLINILAAFGVVSLWIFSYFLCIKILEKEIELDDIEDNIIIFTLAPLLLIMMLTVIFLANIVNCFEVIKSIPKLNNKIEKLEKQLSKLNKEVKNGTRK